MNSGANSSGLTLEELEAFDSAPVRNGNEWRFRCPLCNGKERTFHLNRDSGLWNCKRASCDARGKLVGDDGASKPLSRRERGLAGLERAFGSSPGRGTPVPSRSVPPGFSTSKEAPLEASKNNEWKCQLEGLVSLRGTPGQEFLEKRALGVETVVAAGVRFSPSWSGFKRPAVVFSVRDEEGVLKAAQGRFVGNVEPKAITAGPVTQGVYASPDAWEQGWIILTEAPLDAISLWYCGFPALALCGVAERSWLWPRCLFRRVALAFDADEGGDQASANWRRDLSAYGASCLRLRPEGAKDWNEMLQKCGQTHLNRYVNSCLNSHN